MILCEISQPIDHPILDDVLLKDMKIRAENYISRYALTERCYYPEVQTFIQPKKKPDFLAMQ